MERLRGRLPELTQAIGRPKKAAEPPNPGASDLLSQEVLAFLYRHPGAATCGGGRRFYTDRFRHFVLDLRARNSELDLDTFARAVGIPLGTVDGWLRTNTPSPEQESDRPNETSLSKSTSIHIQTVLDAWPGWAGSFEAFVGHVNENLRVPFSRSFIARILFQYNERIPRRRSGRSPDEESLRGAFETFFPNAQWVGDGMSVPVVVNGDRFDFNLELIVDAYSGAFLGASIRDEEDSEAVISAFDDAVSSADARPLALLLDNRPSNHTETVDLALADDTARMRSTFSRPQNKAHVEGAFGLLAQEAPPLKVAFDTERELAAELLSLRVQAFGRSNNHKPRRDRDWRSRIDILRGSHPTEEEIENARLALEERAKKIERARTNDLLRLDPVVVQILDEAFERLEILDPEHNSRRAIARYGRDIVVDAIAIFEGKRNAGTLPKDVEPSRYILGIVRNIHHQHEADAITLELLRGRLNARDTILSPLIAERDQLLSKPQSPENTARAIIDQALLAERTVDQFFWIDAVAAFITSHPPDTQKDLFLDLARRIHATFRLSVSERSAMERRLARLIWPLC